MFSRIADSGVAGRVDAEHIEGVEVWPLPPEQELLEVWAPVRLQAANLAIQHCRMRPDAVGDLLGQLWPLLKRVAVARDELAAMAADVRQKLRSRLASAQI